MENIASFLQNTLSVPFATLLIILLGNMLGRIKVKGISLETAGILIVAMLYGLFLSQCSQLQIGDQTIILYSDTIKGQYNLISSFGTILFVTSVGYGAGEKFFRQLNKSFLSYLVVGVVTVLFASLLCAAILLLDTQLDCSLMMGLFVGALTSTPGFSTAKETASEMAEAVISGYGIAYLFGVLGVVLFVQILPRVIGADLEKEKEQLSSAGQVKVPVLTGKLIKLDDFGISGFLLAAVLGVVIGAVKIPGINVSLGSSGGCLLVSLIMAHYGHIGPIDCRIDKTTLRFLKNAGLMLFLAGCGVPGGINFVRYAKPVYFFYGVLMTLLPMFFSYFVARKIFKLPLFNALGAICGAMTSTPSLGALISVSGSDDVASCYSITYPIALASIVVIVKIMFLIFG